MVLAAQLSDIVSLYKLQKKKTKNIKDEDKNTNYCWSEKMEEEIIGENLFLAVLRMIKDEEKKS